MQQTVHPAILWLLLAWNAGVQRLSASASRMLDYNLEALCLGKGSLLKSEKVFPCVRMLVAGNVDGEVHCSSLLLLASVTLRQVFHVLHTDLKARLNFFFSVSFVVVVFLCFVLYCF